MVITIKMDVSDEERAALRARVGHKGLATKAETENWAAGVIDTALGDIAEEYRLGVYIDKERELT